MGFSKSFRPGSPQSRVFWTRVVYFSQLGLDNAIGGHPARKMRSAGKYIAERKK
jgi:hypothetical protein